MKGRTTVTLVDTGQMMEGANFPGGCKGMQGWVRDHRAVPCGWMG